MFSPRLPILGKRKSRYFRSAVTIKTVTKKCKGGASSKAELLQFRMLAKCNRRFSPLGETKKYECNES